MGIRRYLNSGTPIKFAITLCDLSRSRGALYLRRFMAENNRMHCERLNFINDFTLIKGAYYRKANYITHNEHHYILNKE